MQRRRGAIGALILLVLPGAAALPWDTFTVAVPRAGDAGLYAPHYARVEGQDVANAGTASFAFELGAMEAFLDAYGESRPATMVRMFAVLDEGAVEIPVTSWVSHRDAPALATDFRFATTVAVQSSGPLSGSTWNDWRFDARAIDYTRRGHESLGPECFFFNPLQGRALREGAEIPSTRICGVDLADLAAESGLATSFTVADLTKRDGRDAARLRLSAEHRIGRADVDVWYLADIPYPVEIAVEVRADVARMQEERRSGSPPDALAREPISRLALALSGADEGGEADSDGDGFVTASASIVLTRFLRGTGPEVAPGPLPPWPEVRRGVEIATVGRFGPADGGETFRFPLSAAASAIENDLTLVEFQRWLSSHPEAHAVLAERSERSPEGRDQEGWRFVLKAADGSAYEVESWSTWAATPGPAPLAPPVPVVRNEARRTDGEAHPRIEAVAGSRAPTVASAITAWKEHSALDDAGGTVNRYCWGCSVEGLELAPELLSEAGWRDQSRLDPTNPLRVDHSISEEVVALAAGDGAAVRYTRLDASWSSSLLALGPGSSVSWTPSASVLAASQPLALDAPLVAGAAGVTVAAIILGLALKLGLGIPLYTRLSGKALLDQETRRKVFEAIRTSPGRGILDTARAVGVGASSVRHHLVHLQREGIVRSAGPPLARRYFVVGDLPAPDMEREAVLAVGKSRAVYAAISAAPGSSLREIAASCGMKPPAAFEVVQRLTMAGLVAKRKVGRKVELVAVPVVSPTPGERGAA